MLNVKLQRESNSVPWGFRMQGRRRRSRNRQGLTFCLGGKDFSCPLQIQKVNPGSLAERGGMQGDDYIIRIGPVSAEHLKHPDAQELIKQQDNLLELTLQRFVVLTLRSSYSVLCIGNVAVRRRTRPITMLTCNFHLIN